MAILLKEALKPNLVQTLEGQPTFIHGGPFANIAHGNNSILATKLALKLGDYVVTEGGFAADLGAEKFFDIVSPQSGVKPAVAVLVASVRALKSHGGVPKEKLDQDNPSAVSAGLANLEKHLDNLTCVFGLPVVVAVNKFPTDSDQELEVIMEFCRAKGVPAEVSTVVAEGGAGGVKLAEAVLKTIDEAQNRFAPVYSAEMSIEEKIHILATKIYGADGVVYSKEAEKALIKIKELGLERFPVCVAKTQMSLSDDPARKGAPQGWILTIRDLRIAAGAGFIVALAGNILTMPGLPPVPAAEKMDLKADGTIIGLF
jgi:formate--tetrahydrofolate ligase